MTSTSIDPPLAFGPFFSMRFKYASQTKKHACPFARFKCLRFKHREFALASPSDQFQGLGDIEATVLG